MQSASSYRVILEPASRRELNARCAYARHGRFGRIPHLTITLPLGLVAAAGVDMRAESPVPLRVEIGEGDRLGFVRLTADPTLDPNSLAPSLEHGRVMVRIGHVPDIFGLAPRRSQACRARLAEGGILVSLPAWASRS